MRRWRELKQQYELKSHDAKLLSENLKQSSHGQQLDEIAQLEATIGQRSYSLDLCRSGCSQWNREEDFEHLLQFC